VTILVRAGSLADSMSDYLIRQIGAAPNVEVCYHVQVADGTGTAHLESLVLQDTASGKRRSVPADALFVLIGSQPRTRWLGEAIARDQSGFIITGPGLLARTSLRWPLDRPPLPLETSLPGVFAAGDVRQGSVKRVASAVGEGAATIPLVHRHLQTTAPTPTEHMMIRHPTDQEDRNGADHDRRLRAETAVSIAGGRGHRG
jgi:thioredoxin reductase (NADPH)